MTEVKSEKINECLMLTIEWLKILIFNIEVRIKLVLIGLSFTQICNQLKMWLTILQINAVNQTKLFVCSLL